MCVAVFRHVILRRSLTPLYYLRSNFYRTYLHTGQMVMRVFGALLGHTNASILAAEVCLYAPIIDLNFTAPTNREADAFNRKCGGNSI